MAPKLEEEFTRYKKSYRAKLEDRRFWQGLTAVVLFYLFGPYLLLWIATRFPVIPETALRFLERAETSDNPMSPKKRDAGSTRPLP